jgi:NADH-ubiquinone oxidoreductase chain 2
MSCLIDVRVQVSSFVHFIGVLYRVPRTKNGKIVMLVLGIFSLMMAVALPTVRISPILLIRVTSIILLFAAALSFNASYIQAIGSGVGIYSGLFQVTSFSQVVDTFIFLIAAFVILPWAPAKFGANVVSTTATSTAVPSIPEYALIILFTTCGASFLVSSADLVSMYLSIELQSFAVYILAALYRDSESATSAGLKYFLLGGLSSGLILLGSALVYAYTGLTSFEGIYSLLSVTTLADSITGPVTIGLTITVVGFLFKIAAAPFHNWAPDVYDGTPTIVTTWLTIMPKISILVFLLELQTGLSGVTLTLPFVTEGFSVWKNLLLISSMLSLIIGTVVGLAQFRIKRLFAYSTISHVGFLLLALAINTEESIESFIFYLVQYSITNLNAFLILLAFGYVISQARATSQGTDIQFISELKGQFRSNPLLGLSLATCLFSMAGIPPLMGFFAKQMVLYSATHSGYYFMSFVAIIVSVISAAYYLRIVRVIHFDSSVGDDQEPQSTATAPYISNVHSFLIATLTLAIALFVFKPSFILNSTHLLALSLFNA